MLTLTRSAAAPILLLLRCPGEARELTIPPARLNPNCSSGGRAMAPKKEKTLNDLFEDGLKDIYYAEKKILTSLPKMAKATKTDDLAAAFQKHQDETQAQIGRLEQVFEILSQSAKG